MGLQSLRVKQERSPVKSDERIDSRPVAGTSDNSVVEPESAHEDVLH
jgi:hypothetical protein